MLRDLKVLRAPGGGLNGAKLTTGFSDRYAVILAVTDTQAQKLEFSTTNSSSGAGGGMAWSLSLRPPVKSADSPESVTTIGSVLRDGLSQAQLGQLYSRYGGGQ